MFVFVVSVLHWAFSVFSVFLSQEILNYELRCSTCILGVSKWIRSNLRNCGGFRNVSIHPWVFIHERTRWKPNKKGDLIRQLRWIQCKKMWLQTKMLTLLFKSLQTFLRASPLRSNHGQSLPLVLNEFLATVAPSPTKLSMGFVPEPNLCLFFVNSALKFVPFLRLLEKKLETFRLEPHEVFFYKTPSHDFFNTFELTCEWSTKHFSEYLHFHRAHS